MRRLQGELRRADTAALITRLQRPSTDPHQSTQGDTPEDKGITHYEKVLQTLNCSVSIRSSL